MKAANVLLIKPTISNYEGNMVTQILLYLRNMLHKYSSTIILNLFCIIP